MKGPSLSVAAAFATERDASYAVRLMSTASDAEIRYTLRRVVGEDGRFALTPVNGRVASARMVLT